MIIAQSNPVLTENNPQANLASNGFVLKNSTTTMAFGVLADATEVDQIYFSPNQTGNYLIELEDTNHCLITDLKLTDETLIPFVKQETTWGWLITANLTGLSKYLIKLSHNVEFPFSLKEYSLKVKLQNI